MSAFKVDGMAQNQSDPVVENRRPLKTRSKPWAQWLARFLARLKVQPNQISIAGIGISAIGGGCLMMAGSKPGALLFFSAAVCIQFRLLCNMMDGLVAVEGGLKSNYGDLFNEIPDRLEDTIFLVSAGYAGHVPWLGWSCAVLAVFTAYLRAFGGSLGQVQDFCGPMAKPHRMFFLTLGCLLSALMALLDKSIPMLEITLWIIAAGAIVTSIRRTLHIAKATLVRK